MLYDVEFLLLKLSEVPSSVLYVYRENSGVLRHRMIEKVRERVLSLGHEVLVSESKDDITYFDGFFGGLVEGFYNIANLDGPSGPHHQRAFAEFVQCAGTPRMLLIPEGAVEFASDTLPDDVCLVRETKVDESNAQRIATYLERSTDLYDCQLLINKHEFREAIVRYVEETDHDLLGLMHAFDEIMLTCIDAQTGTFDLHAIHWKTKRDNASKSLTILIRMLLDVTDDWSLKLVVLEIDRRHAGSRVPADKLVSALLKSSGRLLKDKLADARVIFWILLLLIWKDRLLQGSLVLSFYKVCDEYRRAKRNDFKLGTALDAHWGAISAELAHPAAKADGTQERDLRERLWAALSAEPLGEEPDWVGDLRSIQQNSNALSFTTVECCPTSDALNLSGIGRASSEWIAKDRLVAFEQVIEQPLVVEKFTAAVKTKGSARPTILHGLPGVGKTSIARLFSQAMTCEKPEPSGSPCQTCFHCQAALANDGQLLCKFVDASSENFEQTTKDIVDGAMTAPLYGDRRITVVFHAECGTRAVFDRLLKALEAHTYESLVFVTNDIARLPPTIKSRCERHVVKPLSQASAFDRLKTICAREGVIANEDALSVIVAQSHRRAGELLHRLWHVAQDGDVTLEKTRDRFGLNWPDLASRFMTASINGDVSKATADFCALGRDVPHTIDRLCRYLQQLSSQFHPTPLATSVLIGDPAFMYRAEDYDEVMKAVHTRAGELGASPTKFLKSIAQFWARAAATEEAGPTQYVRRFSRLLGLKPSKSL